MTWAELRPAFAKRRYPCAERASAHGLIARNNQKKQMKTKKVVRKIFDAINYSKKLKISSILPDRDSDYVILLELEDGSKFEIIIIPTRRFV